jgi:cysteine desulfuration protein SufE
MTINEIQNEIIEEFLVYDDWMDKYEYIIDYAKSLPVIDVNKKTPQNLINGCQSKVWLDAELKEGKLSFTADSDAIITKGVVALLVRVFNMQSAKDILNADLFFIEKIGLSQNLSPTRANGLLSMIKRIKSYALAFDSLEK